MSVIGVDIGYGVTKVIDSNGRVESFRSIVGAGVPNSLGLPRGQKLRTVKVGDATYTVGEEAETFSLPLINVRQRNSIESIAYKALVLAAVGNDRSNGNEDSRHFIITGLPVQFMNDFERLKNVYKSILPEAQIAVVPQPAGSFFDVLLDIEGRVKNDAYSKARIGVIDIGTYTTDFILFDKMEVVNGLSGTVTIGINSLTSQIIEACRDKRRSLSHIEAEEAITTGYIRRLNEQINVSDIVQKLKKQVAGNIWSYMNSLWGGDERIEQIILTGGGAAMFRDAFIQSNITASPNGFLSNVVGFFKLGKRMHGQVN